LNEIVERHFQELISEFKDLSLIHEESGTFSIQGSIEFISSYNGESIHDSYNITIFIPSDYPNSPPCAQEAGGRIHPSFHTHKGGTLCLASNIETARIFDENRTLMHFVKALLIPYLHQHSYYEKYGKMPFGELSHGAKGIVEYYGEYFNTSNPIITLLLLKIIAEDNYRGHSICPCGSGKKIRICHGEKLLALKKLKPNSFFVREYAECVIDGLESDSIPTELKSNYVYKKINNKNVSAA